MEDVGSKSQQDIRECYRCGGINHVAGDCRFVTEKCHNCGKVGHIKRVHRKNGTKRRVWLADKENKHMS